MLWWQAESRFRWWGIQPLRPMMQHSLLYTSLYTKRRPYDWSPDENDCKITFILVRWAQYVWNLAYIWSILSWTGRSSSLFPDQAEDAAESYKNWRSSSASGSLNREGMRGLYGREKRIFCVSSDCHTRDRWSASYVWSAQLPVQIATRNVRLLTMATTSGVRYNVLNNIHVGCFFSNGGMGDVR